MREKAAKIIEEQAGKRKQYFKDKLQEIHATLKVALEAFNPAKKNYISTTIEVTDQEVSNLLFTKLTDEGYTVSTVREVGYGIRYITVTVSI